MHSLLKITSKKQNSKILSFYFKIPIFGFNNLPIKILQNLLDNFSLEKIKKMILNNEWFLLFNEASKIHDNVLIFI